jgi:hypothetical protein
MRVMLKVQIPVEAGNRAVVEGTIAKVVGQTMERYKPEAAYFTALDGKRSAIFVLDLKDTSDIPSLAEPWFMELNASVEATPVMNLDDLRAGLGKLKG